MKTYFDTDALVTAVKTPCKIKLNTLYGVYAGKPCNIEIKIQRTMTSGELIDILAKLADIVPDCDLTINIKK